MGKLLNFLVNLNDFYNVHKYLPLARMYELVNDCGFLGSSLVRLLKLFIFNYFTYIECLYTQLLRIVAPASQ